MLLPGPSTHTRRQGFLFYPCFSKACSGVEKDAPITLFRGIFRTREFMLETQQCRHQHEMDGSYSETLDIHANVVQQSCSLELILYMENIVRSTWPSSFRPCCAVSHCVRSMYVRHSYSVLGCIQFSLLLSVTKFFTPQPFQLCTHTPLALFQPTRRRASIQQVNANCSSASPFPIATERINA